ncbi:MAG: hypothetical protein Q8P20_00690 [bacterium]|nr:hypothetical protein [bacterium]
MRQIILLMLLLISCAPLAPARFNSQHNWHKTNSRYNSVVAITIGRTHAYCSGVVLSPNLILTDFQLLHSLYITSGCNNIKMKTCIHTPVKLAIPYPDFKEMNPVWNDLGLLQPLTSLKNVTPVTFAPYI